MAALLEARGIVKSYPGAQALDGVNLDVKRGEVHALLGENGAGKSTLMKTVAGLVVPDAGTVRVDTTNLEAGSPEAARRLGVGTVYQELSLVPQLSVAENILLGRWPTRGPGLVDWDAIHAAAEQHLQRVGVDTDVRKKVHGLGMAERQLIEIAKALSQDVKVLLLDEPTSALSERESARLFEIIRDLKASGVAVVYVSHRLAEVLEVAESVTVLRDGRRIDTVAAAEVGESDLARMMVGREVVTHPARPSERPFTRRALALRARGLARPPRLKPVDLELHTGEVVAVFGLVGAGRTRLARTLFGLEPATAGTLEVFDEPLPRSGRARSLTPMASPADAIAAGMGYLSEDRSTGVVPRMSVTENVTLASLQLMGGGPLIDANKERAVARTYVDELSIRTPALDSFVQTLSGGNQQKVVLARWLCSQARVLILDDPTRGIDVGAKEEVFRLVRKLADEGIAVLYLTSEIKEARALADRVLVMANGRIVAHVEPDATEDEIMEHAGGVHG
jgi:ABC-type sugar transport system ATPase subunit